MEHPVKMLENIHSIEELQSVIGLIFAKLPTCPELVKGTPKLSFVFRLNQEMTKQNNHLVTLQGIEPWFNP